MSGADPHVAIRGLTKTFGTTTVLDAVDLDILPATIHALVGENGAGKSTLGKILAGSTLRDQGDIAVNGTRVHYRTPRGGLEHGIAYVHQEISLVPSMTASENVMLGHEAHTLGVVRRQAVESRFVELVGQTGLHVPERMRVGDMTLAEQQKVEILRALARGSTFIILDEPTAALGLEETSRFHQLLGTLRDRGVTILFISHFLDEVLRVADTVTILRDGRRVRTAATSAESSQSLITGMLGRPLDAAFPARQSPSPEAPTVLEVAGLSRAGAISDCTFHVRSGEIVGLAGLAGSGRTELARAVFGADRPHRGTVQVRHQDLRPGSIRAAVSAGIAFVSENRRDEGIVPMWSTADNISMTSLDLVSRWGVIRRKRAHALVNDTMRRCAVHPPNPAQRIRHLSGGNQQKAIVGRWIARHPAALIVDEPTRGVDIGSRRVLYDILCDLAKQGCAILLISSDLDEVIGMSHRVLVMNRGRIAAELTSPTHEQILTAAFGTPTKDSR
ncbi:sugar ABC transporter ATP-binding protein [Mycobacterium sp. NPDC003323]